jgi:hypothetical protein
MTASAATRPRACSVSLFAFVVAAIFGTGMA